MRRLAEERSLLITRLLKILLNLRLRLLLLVSRRTRWFSSAVVGSPNLLAFLGEDLLEVREDTDERVELLNWKRYALPKNKSLSAVLKSPHPKHMCCSYIGGSNIGP